MRTKILFTISTVFAVMMTVEAMGQIVIKEGELTIIDCGSMPNVFTPSELAEIKHSNTGQLKRHYTAYIEGHAVNANPISPFANEKVSQKFAVSKVNLGRRSWYNASGYSNKDDYSGSGGECGSYQESGSGWRMPNQRELMIIYSCQAQIESLNSKVSGFHTFEIKYWSATDSIEGTNQAVNLGTYFNNERKGNMGATNKGSSLQVRCIKDI